MRRFETILLFGRVLGPCSMQRGRVDRLVLASFAPPCANLAGVLGVVNGPIVKNVKGLYFSRGVDVAWLLALPGNPRHPLASTG